MSFFKKHHHSGPSLSQLFPDQTGATATTVRKVVTVGCIVNTFLMLVKLLTGYFGHSDALMADGFHSLNDMAADILMLVFVGISYRKVDGKYSYGYGKFETFSSFLISIFLLFISGIIIFEAVESVVSYFNGETLPAPDIWTVVVVLFAMSCKEGLYRYYNHYGLKTGSKALVANAWHHRSDAMASIATLIGVTFSHFFGAGFRILDPLASVVIAIFILTASIKLLRPSFLELMERSLDKNEIIKVEKIISEVANPNSIEFIRSRRVGHRIIFDIGIKTKPTLTVEDTTKIAAEIEKRLSEIYCKHIIVNISFTA
ncbi:MAG: cation transporter [Bacteroides sp.]|nr:cation transporter [Bacteroides sp.]